MRTADELQSMTTHPTSETVASRTRAPSDQEPSPYKRFFEALEELEDNKALYGKASFEADIARRRLATAREAAIAKWRSRNAA